MALWGPYRELEHTADIRLEIRAWTFKGLLANAIIALIDSMTELQSIQTRHSVSVTVTTEATGPGAEALFVELLKKIHLLFETKQFLTRRLEIKEVGPTYMEAEAWGESFDPARHPSKTEIKAVTYHGLEVKRCWWGWRARVIFDI